jgi:hypothetical protein
MITFRIVDIVTTEVKSRGLTQYEVDYLMIEKKWGDNKNLRVQFEIEDGSVDSKVFEGVDFILLEKQRLALSHILAAADKDLRSFHLELYLQELKGLQNFLDHVTDVACDMYGSDVVLPMDTIVEAEMDRLDREYIEISKNK